MELYKIYAVDDFYDQEEAQKSENQPKLIGSIKLNNVFNDGKVPFWQCEWANNSMRFKHQRFDQTRNTFTETNPKFLKWRKLAPNSWAVRNEGPAGKWNNFEGLTN